MRRTYNQRNANLSVKSPWNSTLKRRLSTAMFYFNIRISQTIGTRLKIKERVGEEEKRLYFHLERKYILEYGTSEIFLSFLGKIFHQSLLPTKPTNRKNQISNQKNSRRRRFQKFSSCSNHPSLSSHFITTPTTTTTTTTTSATLSRWRGPQSRPCCWSGVSAIGASAVEKKII